MLYSTLLRLWDREIAAFSNPKIPTTFEDSNLTDRVLVHHVAPHANQMSMLFETVLTADGEVERWVHLVEGEQLRCMSRQLPAELVTVVGVHGFDRAGDHYETRVLAMRD